MVISRLSFLASQVSLSTHSTINCVLAYFLLGAARHSMRPYNSSLDREQQKSNIAVNYSLPLLTADQKHVHSQHVRSSNYTNFREGGNFTNY